MAGAILREGLTEAARRAVDAALLGRSWVEPLDAFARAADAEGATLVGEGPRRVPVILATDGVVAGVAAYLAGRTPPDARVTRVNPSVAAGFRADFDDFAPHEIERDPFYVDFLRRIGLGWHATARLATHPDARGGVFLSLKRAHARGHYSGDELAALDGALVLLREAAQIARLRFDGDREPLALAFGDEERAVFALDGQALARPLNEAAARLVAEDLAIRRGCLAAATPDADARLQPLLAAAVTPPRRSGATMLDGLPSGRRLIARTVALDGVGRDLFATDVALLLADPWRRGGAPTAAVIANLRAAFGLTQAEAKVAAMLAEGASTFEIATRLSIAPGTARNHLKSAMAKASTPRQSEFALLCGRLTG